jgi:hypothetical protein
MSIAISGAVITDIAYVVIICIFLIKAALPLSRTANNTISITMAGFPYFIRAGHTRAKLWAIGFIGAVIL